MRGFPETIFLACCLLFTACARTSDRDETCRATSDCSGDLACVSGTCQSVNLGITADSKKCALVECTIADDCCANFTVQASCSTWKTECDSDPVNFSTQCTEYKQFCVCDVSKYACSNGLCTSASSCQSDNDCFGGFSHCNNGACVQCLQGSDCNTNETCSSNTCVPKCTDNSQCPVFYACSNNACSYVGCATDRECVLYESSEFGFCDKTASPPTCSIHCGNDAECNQGTNRGVSLCQNKQCVQAGCESDDECKILLGPVPTGERAVCQ